MDEEGKPIKKEVPLHNCESHFCPLRGLARQWSYSTSSMDILGIEHLLPKEEKEMSGWLWMRGKLTGRWKRRYCDLRNYTLRYAHSPQVFGNSIDHTKDEIITIAAHPAEPWGQAYEGTGPGISSIESVSNDESSVPTTESAPLDVVPSLPTFQTSTLRGRSTATPTPRGILSLPSSSPRGPIPTPLALQNIEGERRQMFGSATTTLTSPPSTSGDLTPRPEHPGLETLIEDKTNGESTHEEPDDAAEKAPPGENGVNGGNGVAKENGDDAYNKKKEMRELLRRLSLTERAEPLKPTPQEWTTRGGPQQHGQLGANGANGFQSLKGGFSHHIWKMSQKRKPIIAEIPIDRCRIDQAPHCPQPPFFWALQPYGLNRVYYFKADNWREQQRWVGAICLARMDAARRRFPEFDKWRQANLTMDVPYKPCKATKKHISSYRHGDHIAIIPSAPAPTFAFGMKRFPNLRLIAGFSLGRLPFLSPLLSSSEGETKAETDFMPEEIATRSTRSRLRMSETEEEEEEDDLDETFDLMETETGTRERRFTGEGSAVEKSLGVSLGDDGIETEEEIVAASN